MLNIIALVIFLGLCFFLWRTISKDKETLPPGPIRWPIVGSLPQMLWINPNFPHIQLAALAKKYGDVMSIGFGSQYAVVVSSYEIMKYMLKLPETTMERFKFQFAERRSRGKNLGIIWAYGDFWDIQRKLAIKRLREFGFGKIRSMEQSIREELDSLISDIEISINGKSGRFEIDENRFAVVPINIVWSCVGGIKFSADDPNTKRHIKINLALFQIMGMRNILNVFPYLKVFPYLSGYNKEEALHEECWQFMKEMIEDTKKKMNVGHIPETFIEVYLADIGKAQSNSNSSATEEQLVVTLMDLFFAASDTTPAAMSWMILFLALNQREQKTAREEIRKASENGTVLIPLAATSRMPYIRAFILETMRRAEYGPLPPPRCVSADLKYENFILPKGTLLITNLYTVFHDKSYWGDPEEFRPERFIEPTTGELIPANVERVVAQFGVGRRICPAQEMAMDTLFVFITMLLSKFSVNVVKGSEPSILPAMSKLVMSPQPYSVILNYL